MLRKKTIQVYYDSMSCSSVAMGRTIGQLLKDFFEMIPAAQYRKITRGDRTSVS
jgi:hypothetical protein